MQGPRIEWFNTNRKGVFMFLMSVILIVLWITGMATAHAMGGFIHVLLILAIVALMSRMIRSNTSTKLAELRSSASQSGAWGGEK